MECIILAGGLGTRLQSVVKNIPKCMAMVSGKPFLYYIFQYLEKFQISEVILSLGFKHEFVVNWVKQNNWPFKINFIVEKEPLGTGGALNLATNYTKGSNVLVINGDTYFDVDINDLLKSHKEKGADITVALKSIINFSRYDNVIIDQNNRIISFQEKQFCEKGYINGGIYLINIKKVLGNVSKDKFSFEKEVLQKKTNKLYMNGFLCNNYFIDIGIPEDFEKANFAFKTLF